MILKKKTIQRLEWTNIEERKYAEMPADTMLGKGMAGLVFMQRVEKPFFVPSFGEMLQVTGKGYTWLQIAPENENHYATVMFDENGKLFQYYFDITLSNTLCPGGETFFYDLILDVVMRPGGGIMRLDRAELNEALKEGSITRDVYDLAEKAEKRLIDLITGNEEMLKIEMTRIRRELIRKIK